MTEKELKRNIDAGREWLKANGFDNEELLEGYFRGNHWQNAQQNVEIWEPGEDDARNFIESESECDSCDIWVCFVDYEEDEHTDYFTQTYGATPKEALENSLKEYDEEMAERRRQRFKAILDKEKDGDGEIDVFGFEHDDEK